MWPIINVDEEVSLKICSEKPAVAIFIAMLIKRNIWQYDLLGSVWFD